MATLPLIDCAGSVQMCRTRVARLDTDGQPLAGDGNLYVSDAVVRFAMTPEVTAGTDFESLNGCGEACVTFKDCDRIKRWNLEIEVCTPDPYLEELFAGGDLVTFGGEVVGYMPSNVGAQPCPDGVSLEMWSKAVVDGALASTKPYWRWVLPRTKWQFGARELSNTVLANPFTGFSEENDNWLDGPANDWFTIADQGVDRSWARARDSELPDATCGAVALVAS